MSDTLRPDLLLTLTPEQERHLQARLAYWTKQFQPLIDAIRDSERLTAADYAVTINCRDEDEV